MPYDHGEETKAGRDLLSRNSMRRDQGFRRAGRRGIVHRPQTTHDHAADKKRKNGRSH